MSPLFPAFLAAFCFSLSCQTQPIASKPEITPLPQPSLEQIQPMRIAFVGDVGIKDSSYANMELVKKEEADLLLILGDYDYKRDPGAWEKMLNETLGPDFPILAVIGNHDVKDWRQYQDQWEKRLVDAMPQVHCRGNYGVSGTCSVNGILFVMSGIGTVRDDTADRIASALKDNQHIWKICAWHKNQDAMQVGEKENAVGWPAYQECLKAGAIVATAHDHSYSRTYLMSNFEKQTVVNHDDMLRIKPGNSFVFVSGLGGESRQDQYSSDDWWAKIYSKQTGDAKYGTLFCDFNVDNNPRRADCYFKNVAGEVIDRFGLETSLQEPLAIQAPGVPMNTEWTGDTVEK